MTARFPTLSRKQVVEALEKAGFNVIRIKGSHHNMRHRIDRSRRTIVPVHDNEDLGRGLLRRIMDDVGMTVDEFIVHV